MATEIIEEQPDLRQEGTTTVASISISECSSFSIGAASTVQSTLAQCVVFASTPLSLSILMNATDARQVEFETTTLIASDTRRSIEPQDVMLQFAKTVGELAVGPKPRRANKLIFKSIDTWMRAGEFGLVDTLLGVLNPSTFPSEVVLAPLAISMVGKGHCEIAARKGYADIARARLTELCGAERAEKLVAHFG